VTNDSTSPVLDQSRLGLSKSSPIQSRKFLDQDRPNPRLFLTWPELVWTDLDNSGSVSRFRVLFHTIGHSLGGIYLNGTKYTVTTVIISPREGIQRCAVINVRMSEVLGGTRLTNNVEMASLHGLVQTKPVQSLNVSFGLGQVEPSGWNGPY